MSFGERDIRLGIVGGNAARGWARDAHLPAIHATPGFVIAAVSSRSQALADEAAAAFGAPRGYGDSLTLVHDPDVDMVVVTVRVPEHRAVVLAALEAGKDVYCEWPLGRDLQDAEALAAAVRPGQRAVIGAQGLSAQAVRQAIALVRDGAIGRLRVLRAFNTAAPWGAIAPARDYLQLATSGASLASIGMGHMLAVIDAIAGPYREIDARGSILHPVVKVAGTDETFERDADDHFLVLGRHESDVVSTLEVMGGSPGRPAFIELMGESGWLRLTGVAPGTYQIGRLRLDGSLPLKPAPAPATDLAGPAANLAEVYSRLREDVRGGGRTLPDFHDAVRITRVIEAIAEASRSGVRQYPSAHDTRVHE